jgi:NAD(P)-dependent dehydrogenase (short-subunit alcohol dehydrogenase family)
MDDFAGKVAVVTGAASGIGRALADQCAREGMKVVLADVEAGALRVVADEMSAGGATVLAVRTDVSRADDVEALAHATLDAFGGVHLLFNNAGVSGGASTWESTVADWTWVLGVNLWGVIHGVRTFVPLMLRQGTPGHVVNTASLTGLVSLPYGALYQASKHAVVTISESLHLELGYLRAQVGVSVLCPAFVQSGIVDAARNRPAELRNPPRAPGTEPGEMARAHRRLVDAGLAPEVVASQVFRAIRARQFYILTHPEANFLIRARMRAILAQSNPVIHPRLLALVGMRSSGTRATPAWLRAGMAYLFPRLRPMLQGED